ncbi:hypothetical protein AVEN_32939-1 [Araneus ventricosus]|uniref:Uncharacterized protein n=1 Tax=Araneus ventricosus TaxID=182803 RepID=A0A4Y2UKM5_ARAVE|nr:hypothetical protein AVEN_32939-1 [Araneus ventricosus]
MDESERVELLQSKPLNVLKHYLKWPFQSLFVKVANEVSINLTFGEFEAMLNYMLKFYIINRYDYSEVFKEFWRIIPTYYKDELIKDVKTFKAFEEILNYDKKNQSQIYAEGYYGEESRFLCLLQ